MGSFKQILLALICLSCIVGFYLLKRKQLKTQKLNYQILGYFLGTLFYIFSFELLISVMGSETSNSFVVLLSYIFYPVLLTISPLLFLYVKSFSISNLDKLTFKDNMKHFLVSIFLAVINIFTFISLQNTKEGTNNYELFTNIATYLNFTIFFYVFLIQNIFYFYLTVIFYINHREVFQIEKGETKKTLNWMKFFMIAYAAIFVILYLFQLQGLQSVKIIFRLCALLYILVIIILGLKDYEELLEDSTNEPDQGSNLTNPIDFLKIESLVESAISSKFFLNSDINLQMFAQDVNSNTKYISKYINQKYGVSFSVFVNELRINEAKALLKDTEKNHFTIEAVAKMVGFNSKSAFNVVFKKLSNQTPTEYRERLDAGNLD